MALSFRQTEILDLARSDGRVVVEDLAQRAADARLVVNDQDAALRHKNPYSEK